MGLIVANVWLAVHRLFEPCNHWFWAWRVCSWAEWRTDHDSRVAE